MNMIKTIFYALIAIAGFQVHETCAMFGFAHELRSHTPIDTFTASESSNVSEQVMIKAEEYHKVQQNIILPQGGTMFDLSTQATVFCVRRNNNKQTWIPNRKRSNRPYSPLAKYVMKNNLKKSR